MAQDYYQGNGVMMNYGHTYDMKREELITVLDKHVAIVARLSNENDELKEQILKLKYPETMGV